MWQVRKKIVEKILSRKVAAVKCVKKLWKQQQKQY